MNKIIYTSYFGNIKNLPKNIIPISIAGKKPDWYKGEEYKELAPEIEFWREWERTKDNYYYLQEYSKQILDTLNVIQVVSELYNLINEDEYICLVCYEEPWKFCHRHLVKKWLSSYGFQCVEFGNELSPVEYTTDLIKSIARDINTKHEFSDRYTYNKNYVPRTTEILSAMMHEDSLMKWSNHLGFKRINYSSFMEEAANKGTYTHDSIEKFLLHNVEPDYESLPALARSSVQNAFGSFKSWWAIVNKNNKVEIVFIEKKLTCPYFGGTLDCLLKINGKYWLIDFKTSNHMNYKYYLQLGSYAYMLKENEKIDVDGVLVLKLNKNRIEFDENVLDLSLSEHRTFFNDCIQEFLFLTLAFYGRIDIQNKYKRITGKEY